ncbi:MAG: hypothetical protein HY294_17755 [Candidatus Rokubacteria bacterium]|nr:hypothetical protein [Candidatus Rokubacteria bacterium]
MSHAHATPRRLAAALLIAVLALTLAVPERTDAEPMTIVALATGAVIVLIIVAYLIIANTRGERASEGQPVLVACVESGVLREPGCWPVSQPTSAPTATIDLRQRQAEPQS